jgi:hypothetical protein
MAPGATRLVGARIHSYETRREVASTTSLAFCRVTGAERIDRRMDGDE